MIGITLATTHSTSGMLGGQYTWVVPWPPLLTVLVAFGAGVLVYWSHRRQRFKTEWHRWALAAIRYTCILLVLFMCYRVSHHKFRAIAPEVVVCLDTSSSMETVDAYTGQQSTRIKHRIRNAGLAGPSRINQAKALFLSETRTAKAFRRRYRVKYRSLSDSLLGTGDDGKSLRTVSADQPASPIGDMVLAGLNEQRRTPTAAIVVVTDGINTEGASFQHVASMAERQSVPIYTIALGSERPTRDIELRTAWADPVAFVNDIVSVSCTVSATGFDDIVDKQPIEVRLTKAGEEEVVSAQSVQLSNTPQTLQFMVTPNSSGRHSYIISTDVVDGEVNATNNEDIVSVDVRDEMIRVLIASSQPNYEYRFLKSLFDRESLKPNPSIQVSTFLQDGDPELSRVDQTAVPLFPSRRGAALVIRRVPMH